jgi:uroporphyrinogen decarboxylase
MTPREIMLNQLSHRETCPVPYVLPMEASVAEKVDRHYGSDAWRQRLALFIVGHFSVDTIREQPISATHGRDIFGSTWRRDCRPWHLETPALPESSFAGYAFPRLEQFLDPVAPRKEAAIVNIRQDREHYHIIGMGWGIFEQTWRIRGFENALIDTIAEPQFYEELVERLTELYIGLVKYCADIPADAIFFGDDWGDQRGPILGAERWRRFIKPAWKRIYAEVHRQGKSVIAHSCGSVRDLMPDIVEIGLDVLESCQPEAAGMNPYELKAQWGDKIVFYGCLGSQHTIPFGTPAEIQAEVRRLCREMGKGGGYILAPAKALQPETPVENAVALIEAFTQQ